MWLAILVPCSAPRTLKLLCVLQVLGKVKQFAKFQHRSSINRVVMRICICHRLYIMNPKMRFSMVLRVKMWKFCVLTPKRHYPAWIRVCWCIACQNRFNGLRARSVERFCEQRKKQRKQELSYRKQIARKLRTQYVEGHLWLTVELDGHSRSLETEPLSRSYTTYY